mgnify:CR=1 FL=1
MLTPTDPDGVRSVSTRVLFGKEILAAATQSVTSTLPAGLPFYFVEIMTDWNAGRHWFSSHGQKTCVVQFPTAPGTGGGQVLWKISY